MKNSLFGEGGGGVLKMGGEILENLQSSPPPPYNYFNKITKSGGCPQNLLGQLRGFGPLRGEEVERNLINVANEGLKVKNIFNVPDLPKI